MTLSPAGSSTGTFQEATAEGRFLADFVVECIDGHRACHVVHDVLREVRLRFSNAVHMNMNSQICF